MNIGGSQANDAFNRIPAQGRIFDDAGPSFSKNQGASSADGPVGAQRSDSLRTVSGNRIDPPSTGGMIDKPSEGAPQMEDTESGLSAIAALIQKFADAQGMTR